MNNYMQGMGFSTASPGGNAMNQYQATGPAVVNFSGGVNAGVSASRGGQAAGLALLAITAGLVILYVSTRSVQGIR